MPAPEILDREGFLSALNGLSPSSTEVSFSSSVSMSWSMIRRR